MVKGRYFLISVFLLIFFVASPAHAQQPELIKSSEFRKDAKAAVDSIYNFRFDAAEERLSGWKQQYPRHPLWTLMDGMKMWWEVLSDLENTSRDEEFFEHMKQADYEAQRLLYDDAHHADGLIIRAISNGYLARQHSNRNEWVTSLNYARKAMKSYDYLLEVQPEMPDLKLAEGLKLYYSEYLPEAYPVVKTVSWFMPDGDKQKGLDLLAEASSEAIFAAAEAQYFLGNIHHNYEREYEVAVRNFERLVTHYPNNNYYARILVKTYYRQQRYDKALQYIDATLDRWENEQLPYQKVIKLELLTWKARILERRGNDRQALEHYHAAFEQGARLHKPGQRSFYAFAGYSAGKLLYGQQKYSRARQVLQAVEKTKGAEAYQDRIRELLDQMPA